MGGDDNYSNLIDLTPKEHYIAHMLLALTYNNLSLISAFCQMAHKNVKKNTKYILRTRTYTSKVYQKLKMQLYTKISEHNKGMVNVRDDNGNLKRITSAEYKKSSYTFHTKGMINVYSKCDDRIVYITAKEYQENKNKYIHRLSGMVYVQSNITGEYLYITAKEYQENKNNYVHRLSGMVYVQSNITGEYLYVTSKEYQDNKHNYTHHLSERLRGSYTPPIYTFSFWVTDIELKINFKVTYDDWLILKTIKINVPNKLKPVNKYKMVKTFTDEHINKIRNERLNTFTVFDIVNKVYKIISKDEYNPDIHITSTRNTVLAKDINGDYKKVSKEDFTAGGLVGQTKGYSKVIDTITNEIVLIPRNLYLNNKDRYKGHMTGKISVVNKTTGIREVINKDNYNKDVYCALGNKYYLIKCMVDGKQKNINYFELLRSQVKCDIIDLQKFNKLRNELMN